MQQAHEPKSPQKRGWWPWPWRTGLWGAILVLLVTIVYLPTLDNGFVLLDGYDVQRNPAVQSLEGLANIWFKFDTVEQYYPLAYSTNWVEYHLWGTEARGYHVFNLLLHAAAAVLVWRLLLRLAVPGAWLAAAIFAVHPVEVESVAWVIERKNLLSCVLVLGSMLAYLRFSPAEPPDRSPAEAPRGRHAWWWYVLAVVLYVAALLSKTVTASMPAVLLVIYWWKRGKVTWRDVRQTVLFFAIGLAFSFVTVYVERTYGGGDGARGNEFDLSLLERLLLCGRAFWFYIGKLLWPHPLIIVYPRWVIDTRAGWQYLYPLAAVSAVLAAWLARTRIGRGPLAAVLVFTGVMVPALGFFNIFFFRVTYVADHFQYHASIALIALVAAAVVLLAGRFPKQARWLVPAAGAVLLLPLAVVAHQRTYVFRDDLTLAKDFVAKDPESWVAHYGLGGGAQEQGDYEEALAHYRKAIEVREKQARDNPTIGTYWNDTASFYVDVGLVQRKMGRLAEADGSFRKAIEIREKLVRDHPEVGNYQDGLGWSYADLAYAQREAGHTAEATAWHHKALAIRERLARENPKVAKYQNGVAASYADVALLERDAGRPAESQRWFQKAIEIREKLVRDHPKTFEYRESLAASHEDLAISQRISGSLADVEVSRRKAIEIREKLARDNPAMSKYQNDLAASYVDLGLLERDIGRAAEAETSFRAAAAIREKLVRNDPGAGDYQDGLAWCYVHLAGALEQTGRPADAEVFQRKAMEIRQQLTPRDKSQQ